MKKLFSCVLALAMCGVMATTALAEDTVIVQDSGEQSGSTAVSFEVAPTYTVTIPATVELVKVDTGGTVTYKKDLAITASAGVRLGEGQKLQVTMTSDFTLSDGGTTLPYTVTVGESTEAVANGATVASFDTSTEEQTSTLHFAADDPKYAGNYSDTVTFGISTPVTLEVIIDDDWDEVVIEF